MSNRSRPILKPWLSARADNRERFFIQIGGSMLLGGPLRRLNHAARWTFFCMAAEAGAARRFTFPATVAEKKYGIARNTFQDNLRELIRAGMIVLAESGRPTRTPNVYEFGTGWKAARTGGRTGGDGDGS